MAFLQMGRLVDAEHELARSEHCAMEASDSDVLNWSLVSSAHLATAAGGGDNTLDRARRSLEIAESQDNEGSRTYAYGALGQAYLLNRQYPEARDAAQMGMSIANQCLTGRQWLPYNLSILSSALLAMGESAEALTRAREGIRLGRASGTQYYEACAQIALANALIQAESSPGAEVESALARAEHLVAVTGGRSLSPRIIEARARLMAKLGDAAASNRLMHEAVGMYHDIGATGHAERLTREITR
jgi:tetratricopeptide (TPR) repeat protein